jgi:hypothetical protein
VNSDVAWTLKDAAERGVRITASNGRLHVEGRAEAVEDLAWRTRRYEADLIAVLEAGCSRCEVPGEPGLIVDDRFVCAGCLQHELRRHSQRAPSDFEYTGPNWSDPESVAAWLEQSGDELS